MIGNDRPTIIGPRDDFQLTRSLGMVPKLTYNNFPLKHEVRTITTITFRLICFTLVMAMES